MPDRSQVDDAKTQEDKRLMWTRAVLMVSLASSRGVVYGCINPKSMNL